MKYEHGLIVLKLLLESQTTSECRAETNAEEMQMQGRAECRAQG